MSSARPSGSTRERTQLFANARPYTPSQVMSSENPYSSGSTNSSRSRTPQFTDAMYDQLESQHDEHLGALSSRISILKDITSKIGTEVKDGTGLLSSLEERFDGTRTVVKNTMTKMIRSADRSGVSWRSWLALFGIVIFCFWFVMFL